MEFFTNAANLNQFSLTLIFRRRIQQARPATRRWLAITVFIVAIPLQLTFAAHSHVIGLRSGNQDIVVTGEVRNAQGEPLAGVSVAVRGTTSGTSTNLEGRYSISAPNNAILIFNYIGYTTKEVPVNNQNSIHVILEQSTTALNEIVVTALGIQRESKSLTYGAQSVVYVSQYELLTLNPNWPDKRQKNQSMPLKE